MNGLPDQVLRRGAVLWRATLDGVLIRRPGADDVVRLGGTGASLWQALREPRRSDRVVAELAEIHGVDEATVAADLAPVVAELLERGVVEVAG